jgi:hypothetical protein
VKKEEQPKKAFVKAVIMKAKIQAETSIRLGWKDNGWLRN